MALERVSRLQHWEREPMWSSGLLLVQMIKLSLENPRHIDFTGNYIGKKSKVQKAKRASCPSQDVAKGWSASE